ncbi:DinB/UmuC family translesion DNA polymerase [Streptomyces anandii]|uniref:DinB/UmuC family translesion DNA polymerase n=1 Tax=Streptomyces anandii TaxID=285454 RepID=UPI003570F15B
MGCHILHLHFDLPAEPDAGQIATGVTCTIRYAALSATRRSRTLPEATQHTVLLARAAYAVYDSLGLQRARVRSIAACRCPSPRRPGHPAAHPRRVRRQTPSDRSRRRPRPRVNRVRGLRSVPGRGAGERGRAAGARQ